MRNRPGTLYETLRRIVERDISYAMFAHSTGPLPGMDETLEIQRFEFDRKGSAEIVAGRDVTVPSGIRRRVRAELKQSYPEFDFRDFDRLLRILWLNNENYVRISPSARIAQALNLFQKGNQAGGLYLDVEPMVNGAGIAGALCRGQSPPEGFSPPGDGGLQPPRPGGQPGLLPHRQQRRPPLFPRHVLRATPVTAASLAGIPPPSPACSRNSTLPRSWRPAPHTYRDCVTTGVMTGEDASLVNAFSAFCHANLAHNQPDRFGLDDVRGAFHANPEIALRLVRLFRVRFDPALADRDRHFAEEFDSTSRDIAEYNTGHRYLDELRRSVFRCCLAFIRHTLKTNFFVPEKQALAFRLDPAYLDDLGPDGHRRPPPGDAVPGHLLLQPLRLRLSHRLLRHCPGRLANHHRPLSRRFHHQRHHPVPGELRPGPHPAPQEQGYLRRWLQDGDHPGRLGPAERSNEDLVTWNLYKLQYGIINAFLDIFVTDHGRARNPNVVDYYGEDEPIELGPDENMHDAMVEAIARLSKKRGYLLGIGLISSKRVGINHKEYGVTSTGVVKFAEITMAEIGIDYPHRPVHRQVHRRPQRRRGRQRHAAHAGALSPGADHPDPGWHRRPVRPVRGRPDRTAADPPEGGPGPLSTPRRSTPAAS